MLTFSNFLKYFYHNLHMVAIDFKRFFAICAELTNEYQEKRTETGEFKAFQILFDRIKAIGYNVINETTRKYVQK